ncbi:hypothetical protein [Gandjariella thermophila]|uniref:Uncharacterized protein n=1 Tax=Gandjariella thermophila TaxID=1931992 RepID=A0A4D4IYP5_9PSEU|nr:hypothetical protein [Gandjariella thermophila]GDY29361.1 hypothetical protein GTS_09940 [Gandjariella thermophila]
MRILAVVVALLGGAGIIGGIGMGVNEGSVALGWGEKVTIHVDRSYTTREVQRNQTTHTRRYVTRSHLEGHYTRDGSTHTVDLDGSYPIGSDVTGYVPVLGGAPTTHTGGSAVLLSLCGFLLTVPFGIGLLFLARYLWRGGARRPAATAAPSPVAPQPAPYQGQSPDQGPTPYQAPMPYQGQQNPPTWQ